MHNEKKSIDYIFLTIVGLLVVAGLFAFFSASLGVLARDQGKFYQILVSQIALGLLGGGVALYFCSRIPYRFWREKSTMILVAGLGLTLLVFVPHLGFAHGGARRWVSLFGISFQPVEFLKIAFVVYLATWLSWTKKRTSNSFLGILPLILILGLMASVLVFQPDTKSLILMTVTGFCMLFLSGINMKHLFIFGGGIAALFIVVALNTPYLRDRIDTYLHPANDPTGSSYQLQQSLIAIGGGQLSGRGFGQSIQKFSYLPEPQGDSIFAVIGEEFGFIGTTIIVLLYVLFAMRGLWIARRAPDLFSGLLASGLVILMSAQVFMNIAAITGLFPLTGVPLVFMSQGGTSLLISLAAVGIILSISKERKTN